MSLITDIQKIELPKIVISILVFLATVAPGFLILYLYKPELIEKLDIGKLAIFSAALTLPVLTVNALGVLVVFLSEAEEGTDSLAFIIGGTVISIIAFYLAIDAAYEHSLRFVSFLEWLLAIDAGLFVLLVLLRVQMARDERKKNASKPS